MRADERRKAIVNHLLSTDTAVPGGLLSEMFGVSRQIIVQDISVLKAAGYDVLSTHKGYILRKSPLAERVFKVIHSHGETEEELNLIVDLGGTVVDVFVWHKVYGKISAPLNIFSRLHVKQFLEGVRSGKSTELMSITGGYHYHTVRADSENILDKIRETLDRRGFIAPEK